MKRIEKLEKKLDYAYKLIHAYQNWFSVHRLYESDDSQIKEAMERFLSLGVV